MNLSGKTIFFLGSSVTYGAASGGVSFADFVCENLNATMIKEAVSGTTLADIKETSYVNRLKQADPNAKVDLFVCQLSNNDIRKNAPIEETEKAIRFIIEYVKKTYNCPIVFYTSPYYDNPAYENLIKLMYSIQKEYGFPVLDLYNDESVTKTLNEKFSLYMADHFHPTLLGYKEWWTPIFIEFFKSL